jgi:hypothetical protein
MLSGVSYGQFLTTDRQQQQQRGSFEHCDITIVQPQSIETDPYTPGSQLPEFDPRYVLFVLMFCLWPLHHSFHYNIQKILFPEFICNLYKFNQQIV